jgi:hypothetical protein
MLLPILLDAKDYECMNGFVESARRETSNLLVIVPVGQKPMICACDFPIAIRLLSYASLNHRHTARRIRKALEMADIGNLSQRFFEPV